MHVKTKKISFLGLLLALSIILQFLGSYIEVSTLSFLVASSLCLGIAIYEVNLTLGSGFLIASIILSFLLMPNKFHCLTYVCLCIYIYFLEIIRRKTNLQKHFFIIWLVKLVFFNVCFLFPALYFFPDFLFTGEITWHIRLYIGIFVVAQIFLVLFDTIYQRLIPSHWEQLKRRMRIDI